MIRQTWKVGLLALAVLGFGSSAWAGETFHLGIRGGVDPQASPQDDPTDVDAKVQNLGEIDEAADNIDTRWHYRGYRGYYGGYRSYYRSYYPRYSYRSYSFGYSYPRYRYSYSYPRYYGYSSYSYYPRSYSYSSYPSYSYYGGSYYCPISCRDDVICVVPLQQECASSPSVIPVPSTEAQKPMPKASEETFEYNGGPTTPVPLPQPKQAQPVPQAPQNSGVPLGGRAVSAPAPQSKFVYPAYGEAPAQRVYDDVRTILIRTPKR